MREDGGRPNDGMMPHAYLPSASKPLFRVITVLSRNGEHSVTPELAHIVRSTQDPAQRRERAVRFFSSAYFQRASDFCDTLTAAFGPGSPTAATLVEAVDVRLVYEAYAHRFDVRCSALRMQADESLHAATYWHNLLFNPRFHPDSEILAFVPIWGKSSA